MTEEEAIFAYIDGELEGDERARVEAAIQADPDLQRMVAEHRALNGRLNQAFSTVSDAPLPHALTLAGATGATITSLAEERALRRNRLARWNVSHWAAMAATLVLGVIGGLALNGDGAGPVKQRGGQLVASATLEHALDTQLASMQSDDAAVRIGLTFRSRDGAICRTFAADAIEGVACRNEQAWQLRGLLSREKRGTGDYRMAGSSGVAPLVDQLIAGEAMDQAQERAALAAGWAPSPQGVQRPD